jgi:hypothetical protein
MIIIIFNNNYFIVFVIDYTILIDIFRSGLIIRHLKVNEYTFIIFTTRHYFVYTSLEGSTVYKMIIIL